MSTSFLYLTKTSKNHFAKALLIVQTKSLSHLFAFFTIAPILKNHGLHYDSRGTQSADSNFRSPV